MTRRRDTAEGRAGGKVILLGEHAVVHGTGAIALCLEGRTAVEARWAQGPTALEVAPWGLASRVDGDGPADAALRDLVAALGAPLEGISLHGSTSLPSRAGLGASASIAAASARAIAALTDRATTESDLFSAVQASERVFHGNPSGVDAAAVLGEGLLRFSRAAGVERAEGAAPALVVVHSGEAGETGGTVRQFAARLASGGAEAQRRLRAIGEIVERGLAALARGDMEALGDLMDEDHEQLSWFGVSTAALDRACAAARGAGALGAKLTGGGGGGCAIALVRSDDRAGVTAALKQAGFRVVPT
jgi:mevalonate kinase